MPMTPSAPARSSVYGWNNNPRRYDATGWGAYQSNPASRWCSYFGDAYWGYGQYTFGRPESYQPCAYTSYSPYEVYEWNYYGEFSRHSTAFVEGWDEGYNFDAGWGGTCHYSGIYSGRWDTFSGNECSSVSQIRYHRSAGVPANYAVFGTLINGSGQRQNFTNMLWGATVYVSDRDNPTVEQGTRRIPTGWTKDTVFDVAATDSGIGVDWTQIRLAAPNQPDYLDSRIHPCSADPANHCPRSDTFAYATNNMPEGQRTVSAQAGDLIRVPAFSEIGTIKIDRTGPTIAPEPTGALYENRNRTDDHRREGLYDAQATIHAEAKDDPAAADDATTRSGTKTLDLWIDRNRDGSYTSDELVKSTTNTLCTSTQCPNKLALDYSASTDSFPDGDYKVKLTATDLAGNPSTPKEWTVTVDRQGDIVHANEYPGDPGQGGEVLAEDWAQMGTLNARHLDGPLTETRDDEACGPSSCAVQRALSQSSAEDPTSPPSAPTYTVIRGTSTTDPHVDQVSDLLDPANRNLGAPVQSGSLISLLQAWQTAPPGHGTSFDCYMFADNDSDNGDSRRHRVCIDSTTKLPVTDETVDGSDSQDKAFFTYDRSRKTASESSGDLFKVGGPADESNTTTVDWASPALRPPLPDVVEDEMAYATDFRADEGFDTDPVLILRLLTDPARNAGQETWGTPLQSAEDQEMQTRVGIDDQMGIIQNYGDTVPSQYAGAYVDKGSVYVGFTGDQSSHMSNVATLFPYASRLRSFSATYTLSQLTAKATEVESDGAWQASQGFDVISVSRSTSRNRVVVGIANPSAGSGAALTSRYGGMVTQEQDEPAVALANEKDRGSVPPVYGGYGLYDPDAPLNDPGGCSAGFSAYRNIRGHRHNFVMTAGHCFGTKRSLSHDGGRHVGHVVFRQYRDDQDPGNVDVGYIGLPNRRYTTYKVFFGSGGNRGDRRPVKGFDRYPGEKTKAKETTNGEHVCISGVEMPFIRCGRVIDESVTHKVDGQKLHSLVKLKVYGKGLCRGDSGGAIVSGTQAVGLVTGGRLPKDQKCGAKIAYATQIEHALNRFPNADNPARLVLKR